MNFTMCIASNMFGIIILLIILFNYKIKNFSQRKGDEKLFIIMIILNISVLFIDSAMWYLDGKRFSGNFTLLMIFSIIYYLIQPLICFIWLVYCEYKIKLSIKPIRKKILFYSIPLLISTILTFVTLVKPTFFYIDETNNYHRGSFYLYYILLCFIYFLISFYLLVKEMKHEKNPTKRKELNFLFLYPIFPLVTAIIQSLFYGISIIWISTIVSVLIIYLNIQNVQITIDALTEINNRRSFESYLTGKLNNQRKFPYLYLALLDINCFKQINDHFGHLVGDDAIKQLANILTKSVTKNDFIARLGGDEFAIIGERDTIDSIDITLEVIQKNIDKFNLGKTTPYSLSISIGSTLLMSDSEKTLDELFMAADTEMYKQKEIHHKNIKKDA